jgi:thiosulfate/3-mercaptopyruvate sulfurtransferase
MNWRHALLAVSVAFSTADAQPTRDDLLVSPAWLATHLDDANLVVLHVANMDEGKREYGKAHIPGARFVELDDISVSSMNHTDSLMLELPSVEKLRSQLAALGISDNSRIVVYAADDDISPSTRVLLTLDYAGLGGRSSLLDGGLRGWTSSNHPVTSLQPKSTVGKLSPLRINPVVTNTTYVQANLSNPRFHLIDGRAAMFYDGIQQGMKPSRKGHVLGAHSIPYTEVTNDKHQLKSPEQLAALFTKAGVSPRDTVVAYCHIGQQATAVLFAARTLGHPVLLYDGSFQEWGRRNDLPVENPSESKKK